MSQNFSTDTKMQSAYSKKITTKKSRFPFGGGFLMHNPLKLLILKNRHQIPSFQPSRTTKKLLPNRRNLLEILLLPRTRLIQNMILLMMKSIASETILAILTLKTELTIRTIQQKTRIITIKIPTTTNTLIAKLNFIKRTIHTINHFIRIKTIHTIPRPNHIKSPIAPLRILYMIPHTIL